MSVDRRGALFVFWSLLFLVGSARAEEPLTIDLGERELLPLLYVAPTTSAGVVSTSRVVDVVSAALQTRTVYAPRAIEPGTVADCAGRLECLVPRLRSLRATIAPEKTRPPRRALLVAKIAGREADTLSVTVLDLTVETSSTTHVDVASAATVWQSPRVDVRSEEDVRLAIEAVIERSAREDRGWATSGALSIAGVPPEAKVEIDGRQIEAAGAESMIVKGVLPGPHKLRVIERRHEPYEQSVFIARDETQVVVVSLVLRPSFGRDARAVTITAGWITAGTGAALGVAALLDAALAAPRRCLVRAGSTATCPSRYARFPDDGGLLADRSGLPLAPTGLALALTGALWIAGATFVGDDTEAPWLTLATGLAAGAASYAIALELEHDPL